MKKIFDKIKDIAPTPQMAVDALGAIATLNWVDKDTAGNSAIGHVFQGDLSGAWYTLSNNAENVFLRDSEKRQQLLNLITQIGVVKLVTALVQYIISAFRE